MIDDREAIILRAIHDSQADREARRQEAEQVRNGAVLAAVGDVIREEVARLWAGLEAAKADALRLPPARVVNEVSVQPAPVHLAPVQVVNEVHPAPVVNDVQPAPVVVHVDMRPVAEAIDRQTAAYEHLAEMVAQALRHLADAPPPVLKNVVRVPEAPPAAVTVTVPPRPKRTVRIRHGDGTESVLTED